MRAEFRVLRRFYRFGRAFQADSARRPRHRRCSGSGEDVRPRPGHCTGGLEPIMTDVFTAHLEWTGADGGPTLDPDFSRDLSVEIGGLTLPMSSAPAYRGDP